MIVCTRNREPALVRCLESLAALDHSSYEVVIVENTPARGGAAEIAAGAAARYVHEPRIGLSRARNAGVAAARGRLVAFLDDDCLPAPTWLSEHAGAHGEARLGATTGRIVPASAAGEVGAHLLDLGAAGFEVSAEADGWFKRAAFGGLGYGGNLMVKRELFDGGLRFRESLGAGAPIAVAEEFDAFLQVLRAGRAIAYLPDALVRHDGPTTAAELAAREVHGARHFSAYLCLLLVEEPRFRGTILRHLARPGERGRSRRSRRREAPRWRLYLAAAGGPVAYLRSRRS